MCTWQHDPSGHDCSAATCTLRVEIGVSHCCRTVHQCNVQERLHARILCAMSHPHCPALNSVPCTRAVVHHISHRLTCGDGVGGTAPHATLASRWHLLTQLFPRSCKPCHHCSKSSWKPRRRAPCGALGPVRWQPERPPRLSIMHVPTPAATKSCPLVLPTQAIATSPSPFDVPV
jgi:hypothetical protein